MDTRGWGWLCAVLGAAAACSFDSAGLGGSGGTTPQGEGSTTGAETSDDSTGAEASTAPTGGAESSGAGSSTEPSGTESSGNAVDDSTGPGPGAAMLVLADAPAFDFAELTVGDSSSHMFVLSNEGSVAADDLVVVVDGAPFSAGNAGTCGDALEPGGTCIIQVVCAPVAWGVLTGSLVVQYDDVDGGGSVDTALRVRGIGESAELLENGDAEAAGAPPPGWSLVPGAGNDWSTTLTQSFSGTRSIYAGLGASISALRLQQAVDVETWAALIDDDGVSFRLRARTRAIWNGDDPHAVSLRFFDGEGELLEELTSPSHDGPSWAEVDESGEAPAGTRSVHVVLRCEKNGGSFCDAYFDDVSLIASYP